MQQASIMLFWDYDTQWGADRSRMRGRPKDWGHLDFVHTERLLELHARYNVPACFAVVGAAALPGDRPYHDPAQIRRIHAAGHEIASHSFRHDWLPGLNWQALLMTLRDSKEALEQCIGAPVVSFVPPYNQPCDYAAGWSISLSERRTAGRDRTNLYRVCEALKETGYRVCRVEYQPMHYRLAEYIMRRRVDRPRPVETIAGVICVRLNTPGGFAAPTVAMLDRCVKAGGLVVVYGHPSALHRANTQDEMWLIPFLQRVQHLQQQGCLRVILPCALA